MARDDDIDDFLRKMLKGGKGVREGDVVGPYTLGRTIGRGAMGTVHEVVRDGSRIAVKVLKERVRSEQMLERFVREARAAQLLDHPNIVRVLHFGVEDGRAFIAMELLEGETLRDVLAREKRMSVDRAFSFVRPIMGALEHAHARGVVHRDVKPENVVVAGETVKLLDFGIAKLAHAQKLTQTGIMLGTPAYMAPEQIQSSHHVGAACDQYAVGIVLYELVSGSLPHDAKTTDAMLAAKRRPPRELAELCPELPASLSSAVMRAIAIDPAARFASIEDLRRELDR